MQPELSSQDNNIKPTKQQPWRNLVLVINIWSIICLCHSIGISSGLVKDYAADENNSPIITNKSIHDNRAANALKGKWVYLLGDSSLRMFNSALIYRVNGTLEDPRFGSFWIQDKGGCEGNKDETELNGGNCFREYVDLTKAQVRLTYSFQTVVSQRPVSKDNFLSPSQQPDYILIATGAWDHYNQIQPGDKAAQATIQLLDELLRTHPKTVFVVMTLISCYNKFKPFALSYNNELRQMMSAMSGMTRRIHLLDRQPSTIYVRNTTRCEGWHAYGDIVLDHVDQLLEIVEKRNNDIKI